MSDTHAMQNRIAFEIPDGDIFVHAGDFTNCGRVTEVQRFNEWLGKNLTRIYLPFNSS